MIAAGTRLGPYELGASVGAGGMGEVYRARDSRLDRTVAIKVLPARLSADPRLRERFEREAKAISALTHPHICTLYDVGSHDGIEFLVMEFLEGDSLAERLARGPLPIAQAIRYGTQIAEALEKAHRAGIVHRDLKPGNVMLTKSGAKLLDFGLAKFAEPAAGVTVTDPNAATAAMSHNTPLHKSLTEEGAILGTFQYMAPEQVEGRDADSRTDIFALGTLLYEMATGKRAFEAKSRASLIASILDREPPPISSIQPLTPIAFERVVRMCLEKDPEERWQSAHDVAAELRWIETTSSESIGPGAKRARTKQLARTGALVLAGLLAGASAMWFTTRNRTAPRAVARYTINTAPNAPVPLGYGALAISPNGDRIVYRTIEQGQPRLYIRDAGNLVARPLAALPGIHAPTFSPDGRWVAFMDARAVRKVSVDGGTPVTLTDLNESGLGVRWIGDSIYFCRSFAGGIWRVSANGGEPTLIARVDPAKGRRAIVWPDVLRDGETVLATVWNAGSWDDAKIVAFSVRDGSSKVLVDGGTNASYSPTGHLLYARGSSLMAVPFNPKTLEVGHSPVIVVNGIAMDPDTGELQYRVSEGGDLLYAAGGVLENKRELRWSDRSGKTTPVVPTARPYRTPVVSPDGRTIAVTLETASYDVWLLDPERDVVSRLSFGGDDSDPLFTPDGRFVTWQSTRSGVSNLYRAAVDGSGGEERLTTSPRSQSNGPVHPNGHDLAFAELVAPGDHNLMVLSLDSRKVTPLLTTSFDERPAGFSPDGRWLLYWSNESGRRELYVRSYPPARGKWQVTTGGGQSAEWSKDGREIFYTDGASRVHTIPVTTSPAFRLGKPQYLFGGDSNGREVKFTADVQLAPDGRFIIVQEDAPPAAHQLTIVLNWAEELKRRVPQ